MPNEIKWIKLDVGFFGDDKIKQIRAMPDGDAMLLIWLNLLVMAGKTNDGGLIYLTQGVPYTDDMLSVAVNFPVRTVRCAVDLFKALRMVEDTPEGLLISNWEKHQNIDGMERVREQSRIRQARKREKDKMKLIGASNKCVYCGGFADTIDHVVPVCDDGPNTPENTVPCCTACNMSKSKYTVASFLNRRLLERKYIDKDGIEASPVLQKIVFFNRNTGKYEMMRDVLRDMSRDVTVQNKNKKEDIEKEEIEGDNKQDTSPPIGKDVINNERIIHDAVAEEEKVSVMVQAAAAENPKTSVCTLVGKAWNKTGFPKVRSFPVKSPRGEAISALNAQYGTETILAAIEKAMQSEFLNELGDRVTLDWFLQPEHFQKIIEGQYDRKWERRGTEPKSGGDWLLEKIARGDFDE